MVEERTCKIKKQVEGMKDEKIVEVQRCLCRFSGVEGTIMASFGEILKLERYVFNSL